MTKPAASTQAAIRRAIRAAQKEGAAMVEVLADGTIRVLLRQEYELAADIRPEQIGGDGWDTKA
jgi:chitinase